MIKFSVLCLADVPVEVTIDELTAVVFDGREDVQLVFSCPVCGEEIRLGMHIPNLHVAAAGLVDLIEEVSGFSQLDGETFQVFAVQRRSGFDEEPQVSSVSMADVDQGHIEDYCEYFRRQLSSIEDVDDVLAEIDNP